MTKLVQVLRTLISAADRKNTSLFLHFQKPTKQNLNPDSQNLDLNKIMQNVGGEQFDFRTFKAAYDTDPRIKTMVKNFNAVGVEVKTAKNNDKDQMQQDPAGNDIEKMAKRATDLGDNLT